MRVLPVLDTRQDQPHLSAEMNEILDKRGAEQFREKHPEYNPSDSNTKKMLGWIRQHGGCVSLKNLEMAFSVLSEEGELEDPCVISDYTVTKVPLTPEEKGVQKIRSGPVLRYDTGGIAENQLASEKPERMAELLGDVIASRQGEDATNKKLAGNGNPSRSKLGVKYQQSLAVNKRRNRDNPYQQRYAEARAVVGLDFPHLKVDGHEFNRKVAELLEKER